MTTAAIPPVTRMTVSVRLISFRWSRIRCVQVRFKGNIKGADFWIKYSNTVCLCVVISLLHGQMHVKTLADELASLAVHCRVVRLWPCGFARSSLSPRGEGTGGTVAGYMLVSLAMRAARCSGVSLATMLSTLTVRSARTPGR